MATTNNNKKTTRVSFSDEIKKAKLIKPPKRETPIDRAKTHKPTTDILQKIATLIPGMDMLINYRVTPAMALDMLTVNKGNRQFYKLTFNRYVNEMNENRWLYNGDSIRFDKQGNLINGQHTLAAIVESNKPQNLNIQAGLSKDAFATIDIGKIRTAGDVLGIAGFYRANTLAAAIKTEIYFRKSNSIATNIGSQRVTNTEIEQWSRNGNVKLMVNAVEYGVGQLRTRGKFFAASTWSFLYYVLSKIDRADAVEFLTRLANGTNIAPTGRHKAIFMLRDRMASFAEMKQHSKALAAGGSRVLMIKIAYTFRAWNAWRKNENIDRLKIDTNNITLEKLN